MTCERAPTCERGLESRWLGFFSSGDHDRSCRLQKRGERIRCKTADLEITAELEIKMTLEKHWLSEQCFLQFQSSVCQANELLLTQHCVSDGKRFVLTLGVIDYSLICLKTFWRGKKNSFKRVQQQELRRTRQNFKNHANQRRHQECVSKAFKGLISVVSWVNIRDSGVTDKQRDIDEDEETDR